MFHVEHFIGNGAICSEIAAKEKLAGPGLQKQRRKILKTKGIF